MTYVPGEIECHVRRCLGVHGTPAPRGPAVAVGRLAVALVSTMLRVVLDIGPAAPQPDPPAVPGGALRVTETPVDADACREGIWPRSGSGPSGASSRQLLLPR